MYTSLIILHFYLIFMGTRLSAVRHRDMIERGDSKEELEKERMSFARIEAECRQRYITEASERDSLISQIDSERAKESRLTRHLEEVAEVFWTLTLMY